MLEAHFVRQPFEIAIVGKDYDAAREAMGQHYLPDVLLLGGKNEGNLELLKNKLVKGQTTIYVCQDKACKMPVTDASKALEQLKKSEE